MKKHKTLGLLLLGFIAGGATTYLYKKITEEPEDYFKISHGLPTDKTPAQSTKKEEKQVPA